MLDMYIDDAETCHWYCPKSKSIGSWCKYQKDILTGEKTYKDHVNLPVAIKKEVEPIFKDLSLQALLSKCLDGLTQNNESLNAFIWKKCPKNVYVSRNIIEIGVASAVLEFNNGTQGIRKVYENAGLHFGKFITAACKKKDKSRISIMTHKSSDSVKKGEINKEQLEKDFVIRKKKKATANLMCLEAISLYLCKL